MRDRDALLGSCKIHKPNRGATLGFLEAQRHVNAIVRPYDKGFYTKALDHVERSCWAVRGGLGGVSHALLFLKAVIFHDLSLEQAPAGLIFGFNHHVRLLRLPLFGLRMREF